MQLDSHSPQTKFCNTHPLFFIIFIAFKESQLKCISILSSLSTYFCPILQQNYHNCIISFTQSCLDVMYYISLCIFIPNSVPLSIGPTLLQRVRALRHSVTTRHSPSFSVTPRHAPSLPFIFRHFALFSVFTSFSVILYHFPSSLYVPSSGYDPYPYQLSPPSSFSDLWL